MAAFGSERLEVAEVKVARGSNGRLELRWREPRKRSWKGVREDGDCVVVLAGHGHPEQEQFDHRLDGSRVTRWATFDPAWREDFDRFLGEYLGKQPAGVLLRDYRGSRAS